MDYTECLKIHGYIVDKSDVENSNVEEIYNKYKPTPVPYNEFKDRVVTLYADGSTSESNNTTSSSKSSSPFLKANPPASVPRNRPTSYTSAVKRPVRGVNSVLQQEQLDQFANSYHQQQQHTDTPIRDIRCQPNTAHGSVRERVRTRVKSLPVEPPQLPESRVYTLPSATNIPEHNTWTEPRPARPPSPRSDTQVPYQPLVTRRQQQQEEEMNDCCCCIC